MALVYSGDSVPSFSNKSERFKQFLVQSRPTFFFKAANRLKLMIPGHQHCYTLGDESPCGHPLGTVDADHTPAALGRVIVQQSSTLCDYCWLFPAALPGTQLEELDLRPSCRHCHVTVTAHISRQLEWLFCQLSTLRHRSKGIRWKREDCGAVS